MLINSLTAEISTGKNSGYGGILSCWNSPWWEFTTTPPRLTILWKE